MITNILNPKVAIFFVAFLPQFVDARGSIVLQILLLGMIFDIGGTLVNFAVAIAAGGLGDRLSRNIRIIKWQRRLTGTLFIGLGVRVALTRR